MVADYLTAVRNLTSPCDEIRLTYPTAPGVAATYSIRADSESNALGMAPCPVTICLRYGVRNSSALSPIWLLKKTSCQAIARIGRVVPQDFGIRFAHRSAGRQLTEACDGTL